MATTGSTYELTRKECVDLLGTPRPVRVGSVSVDDADPVRLVCFPRPDGTVVIPTGLDRDLVSVASDRPITVEFEQFDPDDRRGWVVRGTGYARPIGRRERPPAAADTDSALVDSFADCGSGAQTSMLECVFPDGRDEDLLIAVLEEVIYRLDIGGHIPVRTQVSATAPRAGWRVRFAMADVAAAALIGAVPKAVSLHDLRWAHGPGGWSCAVTIDV